MAANSWQAFLAFAFFAALLSVCGAYCIMVTRNLIRIIIGIELLTKAVTILIVAAGYVTGNTALAQCFVITIIVIEVVVMVTAGGIVLRIFRNEDSIDSRILRRLKG